MADDGKSYKPIERERNHFVCTHCHVSSLRIRGTPNQCGRCRKVWYCSRDCQRKAWVGGHKDKCKVADPDDARLSAIAKKFKRAVFSKNVLSMLLATCDKFKKDAVVVQIIEHEEKASEMTLETTVDILCNSMPVAVVECRAGGELRGIPFQSVVLMMDKETFQAIPGIRSPSAEEFESKNNTAIPSRLILACLLVRIAPKGGGVNAKKVVVGGDDDGDDEEYQKMFTYSETFKTFVMTPVSESK